jgi:fatty-acyl-CoA synthase
MAVYKAPSIIEFVPSLPRSGSGKVQWRELQEEEQHRHAEAAGADRRAGVPLRS